jgi:hypothetical protein
MNDTEIGKKALGVSIVHVAGHSSNQRFVILTLPLPAQIKMLKNSRTVATQMDTYQFYRCPATMGNDWGSSCHGYTDRGRVERRD